MGLLGVSAAEWDDMQDEYENMDDVGYRRAPVANQDAFVELELETGPGDADGDTQGGSKGASKAGSKDATPCDSGASTPKSTESKSTFKSTAKDGIVHKIPEPTHMPQSLMATLAASSGGGAAPATAAAAAAAPSPPGSLAEKAASAHEGPTLVPSPASKPKDVSWEAGPAGIIITEPVTTPSTPSKVCLCSMVLRL